MLMKNLQWLRAAVQLGEEGKIQVSFFLLYMELKTLKCPMLEIQVKLYMVPALAAASWKDCGTHMAILAGIVPPPNQERE